MIQSVDTIAKALLPFIEGRMYSPPAADDPFASPMKEGKVMIFIGGGNGSGKTAITGRIHDMLKQNGYRKDHVVTFGSSIFEDILSHPLVVHAREPIASLMHDAAASIESKGNQYKPGFAKQVLLKAFCLARDEALDKNLPIIVDYHMHNPDFVRDCVSEAKKHGYETVFISPHVDMETIEQRLARRQEITGKPYDLQKVRSRHQQFTQNLDLYLDLFDLSIMLDNNTHNSIPSVIAISHKGNTTVHDHLAFARMKHGVQPHSEAPAAASSADNVWTTRHSRPAARNTEISENMPFTESIERYFIQTPAHSSPAR